MHCRLRKPVFYCFLVSIGVLFLYLYQIFVKSENMDQENSRKIIRKLRSQILLASKQLAKAHRYARSSITLLELKNAHETLTSGLDLANYGLHPWNLLGNPYVSPPENVLESGETEVEVCPEFWAGIQYPFYEDRFKMNCSGLRVKPFESILTILLNFVSRTGEGIIVENAGQILGGIYKSGHGKVTIIAAVESGKNGSMFRKHLGNEIPNNLQFVEVNPGLSLGSVLAELLKYVKTKYTFVARDLTRFDEYARLERLVRLLSYIKADYVGSSHRNSTGHWMVGCYQMAVKNFTLRLEEGYDLSYNSCIYCDYLSGPFAARTSLLKEKVDPSLNGEAFYADLWLKARDQQVVMDCPDAMFHTGHTGVPAQTEKSSWLDFVKKHRLNWLIFPEKELRYSCGDIGVKCSWPQKGTLMPICCFEELTDLLRVAVKEFDARGIQYELEGGSLVGAVKIGGTLPWELDHDFNLRAQNITAAMELEGNFRTAGYRLYSEKNISKCLNDPKEINCGYLGLSSPNWRLEMWGLNSLSNDKWTNQRLPFTKAKVAGLWMNVYASPAAAARNQYNDDIFRHAEHWITLGYKTGWAAYKTGVFSDCPTPGSHWCLAGNYLPVGNLQFKDVWI